ncbi:MAG: zf-HC2 domain-containing protein [Bacillota bacterium]
MKCNKVLELIEEYIMGELDLDTRMLVDKHLQQCDACMTEYEETKEVIGGLHQLKNSLKIKEDILDMSKRSIVKNVRRNRKPLGRALSGVAAGVFFAMFLLTSSIIAFPTFASTYVPELPVVKQLKEVQSSYNTVKQENQQIKKENEEIKQENEKLKKTIKEIGGSSIVEYQTSEGIGEADNNAIQNMVIDFIKAQYKGDMETIKEMCTDEFKKEVDRMRSDILMDKKGDVVFTQITNVAKEGELYLVFVRLNDTSEADDADYQLNFELKKIGEKFLVSFVGKDA